MNCHITQNVQTLLPALSWESTCYLTLKPSVTACRKKSDTKTNKQTNKKGGRNKKQDQQKNEISTETVMVNLFHETKKRKTHTRKCVRHNAEKYSLLLLCS